MNHLLRELDKIKLDQLDSDLLTQLVACAQQEIAKRGLKRAQIPRPPKVAKLFQVPDSIKYLTQSQLEILQNAFQSWLLTAKDGRSKQSRTRIWLLFLLLRYTGMRLGEATELDDRTDFDFEQGLVCIGGDTAREIPMPLELVNNLRSFFEAPMSLELRGQVFRLDHGYVRRIFSERGKGTSIPRELLNPRVLRHSRAVELLREGAPVVIVEAMLGYQGSSCPYISLSDADTWRIMNHYIYEEKKMKTSARNMFVGQISAIRESAILSEIEITTATGLKVVSVITKESFTNLNLAMGMTVMAIIKAPWVVLVKEESTLKTSARNMFCGQISALRTDQIMAEVVIDLPEGTKITSLITDESARNLDLKIGDHICAMVKAFSVILTVD